MRDDSKHDAGKDLKKDVEAEEQLVKMYIGGEEVATLNLADWTKGKLGSPVEYTLPNGEKHTLYHIGADMSKDFPKVEVDKNLLIKHLTKSSYKLQKFKPKSAEAEACILGGLKVIYELRDMIKEGAFDSTKSHREE